MKKLLLVTSLILAASCTHQNQNVKLDLSLNSAKSNIGKGSSIDLIVFDDRLEDQVVGTKEFGDEKIKILTSENIALLLTKKINQNLSEKGFKKGSDKLVEVHVEKLNYEAKRGFFVGKSKGEAAIKVLVKNAKNKSIFTKKFDLSLSGKHFIVPLESTDSSTINNMLQEIVQDVLDNEELLKVLAN